MFRAYCDDRIFAVKSLRSEFQAVLLSSDLSSGKLKTTEPSIGMTKQLLNNFSSSRSCFSNVCESVFLTFVAAMKSFSIPFICKLLNSTLLG